MRTISNIIKLLGGNDLKAKSARGAMKLGIGTVAGKITRLGCRMILARILAPDQIGIMAIIISFSMAFEALTEVGVKQSIIQNEQGATNHYLNAAWWMQVIRALCLYGIAYLFAPWISSFYDNPELLKLLRVSFIAIALKGFVSPRVHVLEKEYKFGRSVLLIQGSAVICAIVSVSLALVMRNVWALVFGFVIEMAVLCIMSFILVPFVPRFEIDRSSLVELMKYARGMFGLPILTAFSVQLPILILGKIISEDQLGLYSYAYLLSFIVTDLYIKIVAPVVLPAFSEKQNDMRALCWGVLHTARWTAFFVIPLAAFIACNASKLLLLTYGPKYAVMAIPLTVLCLQMVVQNQAVCLTGIYLAIGQPHLQRRFAIIRAMTIVGLLYPAAVLYGPLGAAVVIVLSNFIVLLMQVFKARKVIGLNVGQYIRSYANGLWMALPIMVTAGLLRVFGVDSTLIVITISVLVLIATFAISLLILNRPKEKHG